jgi:hypothetical protein
MAWYESAKAYDIAMNHQAAIIQLYNEGRSLNYIAMDLKQYNCMTRNADRRAAVERIILDHLIAAQKRRKSE